MKKRDFFKIIFSFVISAVLLYILLSKTKISNFVEIGKNIQLNYLIIALVLYTFVLVIRAIRFMVLLKNKIKFGNMLPVVFVYNLLNYLLPFKLGEFSYAVLLKKTKQARYSAAFSSFLVARLFDFIVIVLVMFLGLILSNPLHMDYEKSFILLLLFLIFLFSVLYFLFYPKFLISLLDKIWQIDLFKKIGLFKKLKRDITIFLKSFGEYKEKKTIVFVFLLSLLAFAFGFFCSFFLILSLGLGFYLPLSVLLFVIPFGSLSGIVPFGGFANFGTFESLWVVSLIALGYSLETAVLVSFSLHIIQLGYVAILGFIGWIRIMNKM